MTRPPRIILVEDDPLQAEWIAEQVVCKVRPEADIRYFDSEYSFLMAVGSKELQTWMPDFALIDLLIRYFSPDDLAALKTRPQLEQIPLAKRAGVRCRAELLKVCPNVKVAIVTVLDDTPDGGITIKKGRDELSEEIAEFLGGTTENQTDANGR